MKDRITGRLEKAVRFFPVKLTMIFLFGVVVSAAFLDKAIFYLPPTTRVIIGIVFMTFATGMVLSMTQFVANAAFSVFEVFNWRYKVEKTHDPEADQIARKLGAPLPRSINITDNPKVLAVTNAWTRTITVSRKLTQLLTREQFLAVIAHEIGHLKYRKLLITEIVAALLATTVFSLYFLKILILITPIMGILAEWAFLLLVLIPTLRYNEIRADSVTKIVKLNNQLAEALAIVGERGKDDGSETHPATRSRIARLSTQSSPLPVTRSGPPVGLLDRVADLNWDVHFTNPHRYRGNGVLDHVLEFAETRPGGPLYILDVGCSKGVAAKTMKAELAKVGIQSRVGGVDFSKKVWKRAARNLDDFYGVDILETAQTDLPLADVVICSYAAIFVVGERRYNIVRRCAEQLKDDGVLVTNAFPFGSEKIPNSFVVFRYQLGAFRQLANGWSTFRSELRKRRIEMAKAMIVAIRGRSAALEYAESIRTSWEGLTDKQREAWKRSIIISGADYRIIAFFKLAIRKFRNKIDGVV
jgi:Zn-dependent protease with chaperone function